MFDIFKKPKPLPDWRILQVEPAGSSDFGPCSCCGTKSRTVWGFVHSPEATLAAYFVHWTLGGPEHDAHFDLIIGKWGEKATPGDRQAVSLAYRIVDGQGSFMVIDAGSRPIANSPLVSAALCRDQVIGQPITQDIFAIVDAVFTKDERIEEIRRWS